MHVIMMFIKQTPFVTMKRKPPKKLLPWLHYVDFLTDKLKSEAGDARLEVLSQRWASANWWDKHALKVQDVQVMHREIVMWAFEKPCWYARSIIPISTYEADTALFDRLRKESLGHLIFNGSMIKRHGMVIYPINDQSIEYYWLTDSMRQEASELWVRLSEFMVHDRWPFFLLEILLPGLEKALLCSQK